MRLPTLVLPALIVLLARPSLLVAQTTLSEQVAAIAKDARGTVYVACSLPGVTLDGDLNPHGHAPMQSTFKLPLAVVMLQFVEHGGFRLDQPIDFLPSDTRPGLYSPLQDEHPKGGVTVPLRELLALAVSQSDNVATDILLRLIGGPPAVQRALDALGFPAIHVRDGEGTIQADDTTQYRNDAEPAAMVALLRLLSDRSPLTPEHTALLLHWMTDSPTGRARIKGRLPDGVVVAHKTGTSSVRNGIAAATNDVGLITLPDGRRLALAVFVTDSAAPVDIREAVIARIARAVYDRAVAPAP